MLSKFSKKIIALLLCTTTIFSSVIATNAESEAKNDIGVISQGITQSDVSQGDISQVDVSQGDVSQGDVSQGDAEFISEAFTGYYELGHVNFTLTAEENILPTGVVASVTPRNDGSINEQLSGMYANVQDFVAYDISFYLEGEEIQPNGFVKVEMNFTSTMLPENVTEDTLITVNHFSKDGLKNITAEASIEKDNTVGVDKVVFYANEFSVFSIAWVNTSANIQIKYVDETGAELIGTVTNEIKAKAGEWIDLEAYATLPTELAEKYVYDKAFYITEKDWNFNATKTLTKFLKVNDFGFLGTWISEKDSQTSMGTLILQSELKVYVVFRSTQVNLNAEHILVTGEVLPGSTKETLEVKSDKEIILTETVQRKESKDFNFLGYKVGATKNEAIQGNYAQSLKIVWNGDVNEYQYEVTVTTGESYTVAKSAAVYAVYEFVTVETVDSKASGVTMILNNYAFPANKIYIGGEYNKTGSVTQGLVQPILTNGFPVTTDGNSLESLFSNANGIEVNHLFLQSEYEKTGYYKYSSFNNFASIMYATPDVNGVHDFTVYEALGTPSDEAKSHYGRGNFLPFNILSNGTVIKNGNQYDKNSNKLTEGDAGYGDDLYKINKPDYYFGLSIDSDFVQSYNGKTEFNGETRDVIFDFSGDDDLWVYVDGVLLLDIGGIHDNHTGYINFSTGKISVVVQNQSKLASAETIIAETTIKEQFEMANVFPDGSTWDESKINDYFKGDTFTDYSLHNIKMFYMERGAYASNLEVTFNLATIPSNQITVRKELEGAAEEIIYGAVEFGFELYLENANDKGIGTGTYSKVTSFTDAILKDGANESVLTFDQEGRFFLKPNQEAIFNNIPENLKYYVAEVGVNSKEYNQVTINHSDIRDISNAGNSLVDIESKKDSVKERPLIVFTNRYTEENLNTLIISKKMFEEVKSKDSFNLYIEMENTLGELVPFVGNYKLFEGEQDIVGTTLSTSDGNISIKAEQRINIYNILSGSEFRVREILADDGAYLAPDIQGTGFEKINQSTDNEPVNSIRGEVVFNQNASVIITNILGIGTLEIRKTIDEFVEDFGNAIFTFKIEHYDKERTKLLHTYYTTVEIDQNDELSDFITIEVPVGEYTVTELNTLRYKIANNDTLVKECAVVYDETTYVEYKNELKYKDYLSYTYSLTNKVIVSDVEGELKAVITPSKETQVVTKEVIDEMLKNQN